MCMCVCVLFHLAGSNVRCVCDQPNNPTRPDPALVSCDICHVMQHARCVCACVCVCVCVCARVGVGMGVVGV
jgi:hypothetical protein